MKNVRKNTRNFDAGMIQNHSYNEAAGSVKASEVGHHLKPYSVDGATFSTNFATRRPVGKGVTLAVYNNSAAVGSITIGDNTVTSQAPGAVQAGTNHVGIPVAPNSWLYLNTYMKDHVITSATTMLVFIIEDDTFIDRRETLGE